jgi:hypothetical protein
MCYKTDKIERFDSLTSRSLSLRPSRLCRSFPCRSILDCAFGSPRNDKNARLEWKRVLRHHEPDNHDTPDLHA